MGLKGYRLWVMGQLDSNVQRPTASADAHPTPTVVAQVAFEAARSETRVDMQG
jgi:hypothetical protein